MNCLVRKAKAVLRSWFGKCCCGLYYKRDTKKFRKDLFSALVSDAAEISQGGPRYKSTEGFKESKAVLAWVGCRSCVTTHEKEKHMAAFVLSWKSHKTEVQTGQRGEEKV